MEMQKQLLDILASTGLVADMSRYQYELSFKQNGVDSLDVMTILLAIEETLDARFSEEEAGTIRSLKDAADLLAGRS